MKRFGILLVMAGLSACAVSRPTCPLQGQWLSPATLRPIPDPIQPAALKPAVLLGEQHDNVPDHRWELATIERLYAANPNLALGFEMFQRSQQAVLNDWVRGGMSEADFLKRTDWQHVWGFDAAFYMPIFRFARDHHLPMVALNVSRHLVHLTASSGWASVPVANREGVGDAAPPTPAYDARLRDAMSDHGSGHGSGHDGPAMTPDRLNHFIQAQLVWDRAMAEAIVAQRAREPGRTVVAIMGAGHLEYRDGVPHQLAALGLQNAVVLLPVHDACTGFGAAYADAIYTN